MKRLGNPELALDESRQQARRGAWVLLVIVLLGGLWLLIRAQVQPDSHRLLPQALHQIEQAAAIDDQHRVQFAFEAERLIREYHKEGGGQTSASSALLLAALSAQEFYDADFPKSKESELLALPAQIHPMELAFAELSAVASLLHQTGQISKADWMLKTALGKDENLDASERVELLRLAMQVSRDLGQEQEVLRYAEQFSELAPNDPDGWRMAAEIYEYQNYPEKLILTYERLLELQRSTDEQAETRRKLAERYLEVGNEPDSAEQIQWLRENGAGVLEEHPLLEAKLALLQAKPEHALEIADRLLTKQPLHEEAILIKARVLLARQELDAAATLLKALVEEVPASNEGHYLLGQVYARLGNRDLAQQHLARQRELLDTKVKLHGLERRAGRDRKNAQVRFEIAELYRKLGADELAQHWEREARAVR